MAALLAHALKKREELIRKRLCIFCLSWAGFCEQSVITKKEFCKEHVKKICSCGKQAATECGFAGSLFVCGQLLCDDCLCCFHPHG